MSSARLHWSEPSPFKGEGLGSGPVGPCPLLVRLPNPWAVSVAGQTVESRMPVPDYGTKATRKSDALLRVRSEEGRDGSVT